MLSKQYSSSLKTMYFLSVLRQCVAIFGRYTSELENWNASVYWYQYGGLHVPFISTSMRGVGGGVYGLNIVSQINSAGFLTLFNF